MNNLIFTNNEIIIFNELNIKYLPNECLKLIDNYLPYTFENSVELKKAVLLWEKNKEKALQNYGHISSWNVSKISDFSNLFCNMRIFNEDISCWDVSNGENMEFMFYLCIEFNQNLSAWNVNNVKNMDHTFTGCKNFNSDLSNWNVSNVENMKYMFYGCDALYQNLSNWNI